MTTLLRIKSRATNWIGFPKWDVHIRCGAKSEKFAGLYSTRLYRSRLTIVWVRPFVIDAYTPLRRPGSRLLEAFDQALAEIRA